MSGLRGAAGDYLSVRRALGFQLVDAGRLLAQFADFAETAGADTITTDLALQWATLSAGCSVTWHAQRLGAVRGFARWLQAIDPATQVPPTDLLPARTRTEHAVPVLRGRHHRPDACGRANASATGRCEHADVHRVGVRYRPATR